MDIGVVTVVQNLAGFTGEKKLADALLEKDNVTAIFNTVVVGYEQETVSSPACSCVTRKPARSPGSGWTARFWRWA